MTKQVLTAAKAATRGVALALALAGPVAADPTLGVGLSISFGGGTVDTGLGLRLFSDDERDKGALSLGVDYMFVEQTVRPTVGAAYLMDNTYIELNGGVSIATGEFGFGFGGGYAKTP